MKIRKISLYGGAALVVAGGAWWWYSHRSIKPQFQTAAVERGNVRSSISATGSANAVVTVQVGSIVSGNIKELYADYNTKVKKGQVIALIDPQMFQARVDQARASQENARAGVLNAKAMLDKVDADISGAEANVANLRANVARSKSAVVDAKGRLERRLDLGKQGILSREELDTAQANYDQAVAQQQAAEAQVQAAERQVQAAKAQRAVAEAQIHSAEAQVKQSAASLAQAEFDLRHTRIVAPVDGTVISRSMDVGQTVAASFQAPTIFQIAQDLTHMQVETSVDEADIGRVQEGQPATFTVDAHPGQTFRGQVTQIRQAPINLQNVITYSVVVNAPNPDLKLFPGMTANVRIMVDEARNVLHISNATLRYRPSDSLLSTTGPVQAAAPNNRKGGRAAAQKDEQVIWVLGEDGQPRPVTVKLGISDGRVTAVESAELREGDRVITAETNPSANRKTAAPVGGAAPRMRGF
jgi:HlyD family secretion protein